MRRERGATGAKPRCSVSCLHLTQTTFCSLRSRAEGGISPAKIPRGSSLFLPDPRLTLSRQWDTLPRPGLLHPLTPWEPTLALLTPPWAILQRCWAPSLLAPTGSLTACHDSLFKPPPPVSPQRAHPSVPMAFSFHVLLGEGREVKKIRALE